MKLSRRGVLTAGIVAGATIPNISGLSPAGATPRGGARTGATITDIERRAEELDPPIFLLESRVPKQFSADKNSTIEISADRAKVGEHSLAWTYTAGATLTVKQPLRYDASSYNVGDDQAWMGTVDTFCVWIYNETPSDKPLRIEFGRGANSDCWFDFGLDFSGWRTCWVRFGYDTEGTPHHGMNRVRFIAPAHKGRLYIDQVILNTEMRPDHPTPDDQVPNVQPEIATADNHHWLALLEFRAALAEHPLPPAASTDGVADVRHRLLASLAGKPSVSTDALATLTSTVDALGVPTLADDSTPTGSGSFVNGYQSAIWPIELRSDIAEFASVVTLRKVTDAMLTVAQAVKASRDQNASTAAAFATLYLRLFAHLEDQGFATGSAQGSIHHIGYQYRGFADSLLLAQPVLENNNLWDRARSNLSWFFGVGRLTQDFSDPSHYGGLVDVLNTLLQGLIISGLTQDDENEQATVLTAVTAWLNRALTHSPGLSGGFKPDGTTFHHMGPYPDYARDAFAGMSPVIALLHGTAFGVSTEARQVLRTALLTQRIHTNTTQWPLSLTGRHPTGDKALHVPTFQRLAGVPHPGEAGSFDTAVGAAFLRLLPAQPTNAQKEFAAKLTEAGISKEPAPGGNWQLGYAACGLHRRDEWLVTMRGHSRYLWSTEIYDGANLYGRYSTYGTVEIQAVPDATGQITHAANGYVQPGWDWNRFPGATTRHLGWEQLKADLTGTIEQMVLTRSAFAGAGSWKGTHGVFGMHLMEHPFFDETHTARLSRFSFDDLIVVLGSDISNASANAETETTLYQVRVPDGSATGADSTQTLTEGTPLVDPLGNGYYVASGQKLRTISAAQSGPDQSGAKTGSAEYQTALLRHGTAPNSLGYEYAILVQAGEAKTREFTTKMTTDAAPYTVVRKDAAAHVVSHRGTAITASVCFSSVNDLTGMVTGTDTPCLLMEHVNGEKLELSVTDPDLHLYEGDDPDQFAADGTYEGRMTSYSRPWRANVSAESTVTLTLAGRWSCTAEGVTASVSGDATTLTVTCQHAASRDLTLTSA
ncbi:chondroitinase family polysaccharide lyase [Paramicrobacterium chengjingii]|uniref:chondroitinase family polysaccharide lyase n=1 Tax=Paramicrobacterium chengjingii TaxID=2769067 RepID=UPI00141EFD35|nr:chondroitinase family polysaccharide lyase [Microbacterium chengjingii]